jgi:multidrug efflux pump subunit AcrA (membrane-fusion protein)
MSKRYTVLGLSVFLALALAVPALGGPTNPVATISASAKAVANKALKKAKAAQTTAEAAQSSANNANGTAEKALAEAKKAQTTGSNAQTSANTAKAAADAAKATADAAKTAATNAQNSANAANANANTRIKESTEVVGELSAENTTTPKLASASCPSGDPVLGGGYSIGGESNRVTVTQSEEQFYGGGWFADAQTINGQAGATWSLLAIAICGTK